MFKLSVIVCSLVVLALMISSARAEEPLLPEGCVCATTDEQDPVCGNNGVTYPNLSTLRCADQCHKYSIHQMHHGPCKT